MFKNLPGKRSTLWFACFFTVVLRVHGFSSDTEARSNSTQGRTREHDFSPAPGRPHITTEDPGFSKILTNNTVAWNTASLDTSESPVSDRNLTQAPGQNDGTTATYTLYMEDCVAETVDIFGNHGVVNGLFRKHDREVSDAEVTCRWALKVPHGFRVSAKVERLPPCRQSFTEIRVRGAVCRKTDLYLCNTKLSRISQGNEMHYELTTSPLTLPRFRIEFKNIPNELAHLPVHMTSPMSGYVTEPEYVTGGSYFCQAFYNLVVSKNYVVLVSFRPFTFSCEKGGRHDAFLELRDLLNNRTLLTVRNTCRFNTIRPRLYNSSLAIHYFVSKQYLRMPFKILFSFLRRSLAPIQLPSGLLDCAVPHYASFKSHVHCNLQPECEGGEDEGGHCPFSSPTCNGSVAADSKCYKLHSSTSGPILWNSAQQRCQTLGGNLGMMKNDNEWEAFSTLLDTSFYRANQTEKFVHTGLQGFQPTMPNMYQHTYRWVDGTVAYGMGIDVPKQGSGLTNAPVVFLGGICSSISRYYRSSTEVMLKALTCIMPVSRYYVCETQFRTNHGKVSFPAAKNVSKIFQKTNVSLVPCPGNHATHDFLSCDPDSHCGASFYTSTCIVVHNDVTSRGTATDKDVSTTETFPCSGSGKAVHYSLVCDFRNDCPDGSDETFCVRQQADCDEFRCTNGQCVPWSQRCDTARNCWDGSDEQCSQTYLKDQGKTYRISAPAIVHFDGLGNFTQMPMAASDPCPDTHFRCSGNGYCLPVYVRCNGVFDCPDHEDEVGCEQFSCPGFYRCRGAAVCLHAEHLCDGWSQCPQHDDELFCQASCPKSCLCQGLAVVRCRRAPDLHAFPEIRYLDVSGSGMTTDDVTGHFRLVWLSLARCRLRFVTAMDLPNLRTLDLRDNQLSSVNMSVFLSMGNLHRLLLADNPLAELLPEVSERVQRSLQSVDLSNTSLPLFGSGMLSNFPQIESVNISTTPVTTIMEEGFSKTPRLRILDLKGCPVQTFPGDVFKRLQHLAVVYADNYKLCCKETLPDLPGVKCFAPQDEISSCQDLLRSDLYRAFLWIFSAMSIAGNAGCVIFRLFFMDTKSQRGFNLFVTNLCVSDFLMGIYLTLVGAADSIYRGRYLSYETLWRHSVGCKLAGFLSFLSNEVSAIIICLITLDRFLILRFPFSHVHFKGRSAAVACWVAWIVGFVLATIPFLPVASQWQFYSQTGICIPLPITRRSFKGRNYAFSVMIVMNFILFLSIAVGQAIIFWTIRASSISRDSSTKKSKDAVIARHLASIVVSDFLCWFPIGLLGVMASVGMPIPSEVNVGIAIFVLPLNSALNPFLYTFNLILEKWEKAEEMRMLRDLQLTVMAEGVNPESSDVLR